MDAINTNTSPVTKIDGVKLTLVEDRIILMEVEERFAFDIESMNAVRKANLELANNLPYCVVMKAELLSTFSGDVMKKSASESGSENRIALAIVDNNLGMKLVANFYLRFNNPVRPTKVFKSVDKAVSWLREMRDEFLENS